MARSPAPPRSGFSLLELMIALAISALVGALAWPSFGGLLMRQRLQAVAHNLQGDIALARQEASRRGQTVHLVFQPGPRWCYALSTGPTRDCRAMSPADDTGVIKVVHGPDHPGITLLEASTMALDARSGTALQAGGQARFANVAGQQMQVRLGRLGRASLCAPAAPMVGTAPCPARTPTS